MAEKRSMLRATLDRLEGIDDLTDPLVVCNADHHEHVAAELTAAGFDPRRIILEPIGRNTAPAAAAAAVLRLEVDGDDTLLVLPADHVIHDTAAFHEAIALGAAQAKADRLVTFGIVPDHPETGYGYIRLGSVVDSPVATIAEFVEKPDLATAEKYLASGDYLWNSGIFMFGARRYLEELKRFEPAMVEAVAAAVALADRDPVVSLDPENFGRSPSNSIDFAVMEHTMAGVVVPLDAGWSDVGSWNALWEIARHDDLGNVVVGDVSAIDTSGSYLRSESRLLAVIGLKDMIVVETTDAVLVVPRDRAQDVSRMVQDLKAAGRKETTTDRDPEPGSPSIEVQFGVGSADRDPE